MISTVAVTIALSTALWWSARDNRPGKNWFIRHADAAALGLWVIAFGVSFWGMTDGK